MLNVNKPNMPITDTKNPLWVPEVSSSRALAATVQELGVGRRWSYAHPFMQRLASSTGTERRRTLPGSDLSASPSAARSLGLRRKRDIDPSEDTAAFRPRKQARRDNSPQHSLRDITNMDDWETLCAKYDVLRDAAAEVDKSWRTFTEGYRNHSQLSAARPSFHELLVRVRTLCPLSFLEACEDEQELAAYLGEEGFLNANILNLLRGTSLSSLSLTNSLADLELQQVGNALNTLALPDAFCSLRYLDLTCVPLDDSFLACFNRLLRLETLHLGQTGIGSESLCQLAPLKDTLQLLHLQNNPLIDDAGIPMLGFLHNLRYLDVEGTSITMQGIKRLARKLDKDGREMRIGLPDACEDYLANLLCQYNVDPEPPLITSPHAVPLLSEAALRVNLASHHAYNPAILTTGTRAEMVQRLSAILATRKLDLLVMTVFGRNETPAIADTGMDEEDDAGSEQDTEQTEVDWEERFWLFS